jgi:hypothetical protein
MKTPTEPNWALLYRKFKATGLIGKFRLLRSTIKESTEVDLGESQVFGKRWITDEEEDDLDHKGLYIKLPNKINLSIVVKCLTHDNWVIDLDYKENIDSIADSPGLRWTEGHEQFNNNPKDFVKLTRTIYLLVIRD